MLALLAPLLLLATSFVACSPTTGLVGSPAAFVAAADAGVRGEAAPRVSPKPAPFWFATYEPLIAELDAAKVGYILGTRDAFYAEARRRWLCFRPEAGGNLRCFEWPARAPRLTEIDAPLPGRDDRWIGSPCVPVI
jgi:hypothetical protein